MFESIDKLSNALIENIRKYKLISLSRINIKGLFDALNYIRSDEDTRFLQLEIRKNKIGKLLELALKNNHPGVKASKLTKEFTAVEAMILLQSQHKALCDLFNNSAVWSDYFNLAQPGMGKKIESLANEWQCHGRYAYFTTLDLIYVYQEALAALYNWLKFAKLELIKKKKKVPDNIKNAYMAFLNEFEGDLSKEKLAIREALLFRLEIGAKSGELAFDDVAQATAIKLQSMNVLPKSIKPKAYGVLRTTSANELKEIRKIFQTDGDHGQRLRLEKILYDTKDGIRFIHRTTENGHTFSIPHTYASYVPKTPPFYTKLPKWMHGLFLDAKIRYELLQNEQGQYLLLNHLKVANLTEEEIASPLAIQASSIWQHLETTLGILLKEKERAKQEEKGLSRLFHKKAKELIFAYTNYLNNIGRTIIQKQAQILNNVITAINARLNNQPLSAEEINELQAISKQFEKICKDYFCIDHESTSVLMRLTLLLSPHQTMLADDTTYEQASNVVRKLATGQKITDKDRVVVEHAKSTLPAKSDLYNASQISFVQKQRVAERNIPELLLKELKAEPLKLDFHQLVEHLEKIKDYAEIVKDKQLMPIHELQEALYHYVHQVLFAIYSIKKGADYTKITGKLRYITDKLKLIAQGDEALCGSIKKIADLENQSKIFDWAEVINIYVEPLVKAITTHHSNNQDSQDCFLSCSSEDESITSTEENNSSKEAKANLVSCSL